MSWYIIIIIERRFKEEESQCPSQAVDVSSLGRQVAIR